MAPLAIPIPPATPISSSPRLPSPSTPTCSSIPPAPPPVISPTRTSPPPHSAPPASSPSPPPAPPSTAATASPLPSTTSTPAKPTPHSGDVDEYQTLLNCSGLPLGQAIACGIINGLLTTDGSLVDGAEFAGSTLAVTLDGPDLIAPLILNAVFFSNGGNSATANWSGFAVTEDVAAAETPEPSTCALFAAGLVGLIAAARRRRA
ncbi:MAG: PEP-CTERM sorting domain-containing protein [Bryobacterales bacterium]|nr:PEP-CTERM sorting domain-containing protein [Bryobacterales bacterium]